MTSPTSAVNKLLAPDNAKRKSGIASLCPHVPLRRSLWTITTLTGRYEYVYTEETLPDKRCIDRRMCQWFLVAQRVRGDKGEFISGDRGIAKSVIEWSRKSYDRRNYELRIMIRLGERAYFFVSGTCIIGKGDRPSFIGLFYKCFFCRLLNPRIDTMVRMLFILISIIRQKIFSYLLKWKVK